MVRKRFTDDGNADKGQANHCGEPVGADDSDQRAAVKGYKKLLLLIFLFIAVLLFRTFVFDVVTVSGESMETSFFDGDVLVVKADVSEIKRYDVVTAKAERLPVIKRVIGLPGEIVQIKDGAVFINDEKLEGQYDFFTADAGVASEAYALGEDEYFLMGDNRAKSADSRDFGGVSIENIKGVVTFQIYPFTEVGEISNCESVKGE